MADFGGFPVNQHQRRGRKKSERIMIKTYFSNFKNTIDNPVDVDAEADLERTNALSSNEQGSSKGKEAEVERTHGVPSTAQRSRKGKVLEIPNTQEPTEAEVERAYGVPRPAHASSKGKDVEVERTYAVPNTAQGSSKGKVLEILNTQEPTAVDQKMVSGDNVRNEAKSPNEIMYAPRKVNNEKVKEGTECIIMMRERIADLHSSRTEADMLLQGYVERFSGDNCFDQFKHDLARMFKDSIWETRQDEGQRSDKVLTVVDVTPPKMTTTSDPFMLSPLSQFWTSPTVIAEVDRASNDRAAITAKGVGCNTDPKLLEK
ncbi:hypothetical protein Ccrd_008177, partial [Cynara cardunculus var. scolymus]